MLGYEVKEEASVSAVKVTYNTLWFNLDDVLGITNIKLIEATSQLNANYVYLNNSSTIFETKKVGGFSLKINLDVMILNYVKVINIIMIKSMKN